MFTLYGPRKKPGLEVGRRFGKLAVLGAPFRLRVSGKARTYFVCQCDCGTVNIVVRENLLGGKAQSCGCVKRQYIGSQRFRTHGGYYTRLNRVWNSMMGRCTNPRNAVWDRYGGRGIKVCEAWRTFSVFREWAIATGYIEHEAVQADPLTIDRIDNDGDYEPSNCEWIPRTVNAKKMQLDRRKKIADLEKQRDALVVVLLASCLSQ